MRAFSTFALFLAFLTAFGQAGPRNGAVTVDIRATYDIWPSDAKLTLSSIYTLVQAKAKHPDLWVAAPVLKLTDADVMALTLFEAAVIDATWKNAQFQADPKYPIHGGMLLSRNDLILPNGAYYVTYPMEYAFGSITGSGNGTGNADYGGQVGDTEILPWRERWKGDPKHIVVMRAFHHGSNEFIAYSEGVQLSNFRITGLAPKWHSPSQVTTGLQAWDMGEGSDVTELFIHQCDTGLNIIRGTPFTSSGVISLFSNNCAGLAITGGGTINIATLSMDDNGRAVHSRPGYGRASSCRLNIGAVKSEWYVTDATYGRTPKPNTWELEGWSRVNIGVFSHAIGAAYQDALFVVKPDVNTSHIRVNDFTLFAHSQLGLLLRDRVNKEAWGMDHGFTSSIQEFRWTSVGGGNLESWPVQAPRIDYPYAGAQLGYLKANPVTGGPVGVFDRVAGLPSWSDVTGSSSAPVTPPPACTYTYSAWSACVSGQQTRTVTSTSPAGCAGTPVLSQPCTAPPTGTWVTVWTGGQVSSATCRAINQTAMEVRVTNLKATSLAYGRLLGTGVNMPSVQLYPDGYWYMNGVKLVSTNTAKVVVGTAWSGALTVPSSTFTAVWQTNCGQGGAIPGTCDKVEVR